MRVMISTFVIFYLSSVLSLRSNALFGAENFSESVHQPPVHFVDFHIGQGFVFSAVGNPIGQAFLAVRNRRAKILVENFGPLDPRLAECMNPTGDFLGGEL